MKRIYNVQVKEDLSVTSWFRGPPNQTFSGKIHQSSQGHLE